MSLLIVSLTLGACVPGGQLVREQLDPLTGITATRSTESFVFYVDSSARDGYSRDFVNIGPLRINRMGEHHYYLWLGIWSTIRGRDVSSEIGKFESINIVADGEPIRLPMHGQTFKSINMSERVYPKPAFSGVDAFYEVTIEQLRLIAGASEISFSTGTLQDDAYLPWKDHGLALESMRAFLDYGSY